MPYRDGHKNPEIQDRRNDPPPYMSRKRLLMPNSTGMATVLPEATSFPKVLDIRFGNDTLCWPTGTVGWDRGRWEWLERCCRELDGSFMQRQTPETVS